MKTKLIQNPSLLIVRKKRSVGWAWKAEYTRSLKFGPDLCYEDLKTSQQAQDEAVLKPAEDSEYEEEP